MTKKISPTAVVSSAPAAHLAILNLLLLLHCRIWQRGTRITNLSKITDTYPLRVSLQELPELALPLVSRIKLLVGCRIAYTLMVLGRAVRRYGGI